MDFKCVIGQYGFGKNISYYKDKGNAHCIASVNPYPCCTGAGTGTCNDYQLDTGSPGIGTGEGGIDIGAYGGPYAIDW